MNDFASTQNSGGLLKNYYPDSGESASSELGMALQKKRKKLAETKLGLKEEDENGRER